MTSQTTTKRCPLVVDLDGTLTPTDTLVESGIRLLRTAPWRLFQLFAWLLQGRARLKQRISEHVQLRAELLPYREDVIAYLRNEKAEGRRLVLATAAHHSIADAVAEHLKIFDSVIASTESSNLKGVAKLRMIKEQVGEEFVYAGDSRADVPIWKEASAAVLVGVGKNTAKVVSGIIAVEQEFPSKVGGFKTWVRALRVHQWLKNLLLFVPLLTSFTFTDINKLFVTLAAFLSFSLLASATYIANDLWDLENDRLHVKKKHRPFASASLLITHGVLLAMGAVVLAFSIAAWVSLPFLMVLLAYLLTTTAYSLTLKTYVLIDVLVLAILYTVRVVAGAVVVETQLSSWLLAFSFFVFFSLALVKRCAELVSLQERHLEAARGRDYRVSDLTILWPLGVGAALASVVVFGLFISATETQNRYGTPQLLWLVAVGLTYWLSRLWLKTSRGEMHDDPVVYAMKDWGSFVTVSCMAIVVLVAHFLKLGA